MSAAGPDRAWRKRWRRAQLRAEGSLDGAAADRLLPWLLAATGFVVFAALDAAAIRAGEGGAGQPRAPSSLGLQLPHPRNG